jgi:cell division protein FtsB
LIYFAVQEYGIFFVNPTTNPWIRGRILMSKKIIAIVLVLILGGLLVVTVFGPRGVLHMLRLKDEVRQLEEGNQQLKAENFALRREIDKLKSNPKYLEDKAREELGLAKGNELVYELKKNKK